MNAIGLWRATHRYRSDDSLERVSRMYFLLFQWLEYALSTTPQKQHEIVNLILSDVFGCDSCMYPHLCCFFHHLILLLKSEAIGIFIVRFMNRKRWMIQELEQGD